MGWKSMTRQDRKLRAHEIVLIFGLALLVTATGISMVHAAVFPSDLWSVSDFRSYTAFLQR